MAFYSMPVGHFELISVVSQPESAHQTAGFFAGLNLDTLEPVRAALPDAFAGNVAHLRFGQSSCVLRSPEHVTVIDACMPLGKESWPFMENLVKAGLHAEDVTQVFITHRDGDHIGGLADRRRRENGITFKNARHFIARSEWEAFQHDEARTESLQRVLRPIEAAGLLEVIEPAPLQNHAKALEFAPGLKALLTPGHRSGATSVLVENHVLLTADVLHTPFQVTHPEISIDFDADKKLAAHTRAEVIELAEQQHWVLHVPHTPPFGLGRVMRGPDGTRHWQAL